MKYAQYGKMIIDEWRVSAMPLASSEETVYAALATTVMMSSKESKLIPTIAGFATLAAVNTAAVGIIAADGPLPILDVVGLGILAIPDAAIFAFGYSLFD